MSALYYFVMIPMMYAAFLIFFTGIIFRIVKIFNSPRQDTTLRIFPEKNPKWLYAIYDTFLFPTIRKHNPVFWIFLILYHFAFLILILGHLELIREFKVLQVIEHDVFIGKGIIGLILTISLIYFLFRRFHGRNRELSVPSDFILLILLLLTVLFGSHMDWVANWSQFGFDMTVEDYREYLSSIVAFKPYVPENIAYSPHYVILMMHVLFANLFLIYFPFSKIMHSFFSLPLNKLRRG